MTDIEFICPTCKKILIVDESEAGLHANCPGCQASIIIPEKKPIEMQQSSASDELRTSRQASHEKKCPFCNKSNLAIAITCKHCRNLMNGSDRANIFSSPQAAPTNPSLSTGREKSRSPVNAEKKKRDDSPGNERPSFFWLIINAGIFCFNSWLMTKNICAKTGYEQVALGAIYNIGIALVYAKQFKGLLIFFVFSVFGIYAGYFSLTAQLEKEVTASIEQTLAKNPETSNIKVNSLKIAHLSDAHYEGLLEASTTDGIEIIKIDVTYDGNQFSWKIRPSSQ